MCAATSTYSHRLLRWALVRYRTSYPKLNIQYLHWRFNVPYILFTLLTAIYMGLQTELCQDPVPILYPALCIHLVHTYATAEHTCLRYRVDISRPLTASVNLCRCATSPFLRILAQLRSRSSHPLIWAKSQISLDEVGASLGEEQLT